jgi:hypothetical protein
MIEFEHPWFDNTTIHTDWFRAVWEEEGHLKESSLFMGIRYSKVILKT